MTMKLKNLLRFGLIMSVCSLLLLSCKKDSPEPDKPEPTPVNPVDTTTSGGQQGQKDPNQGGQQGQKDPNQGGQQGQNDPNQGGQQGQDDPNQGGQQGQDDPNQGGNQPQPKSFTIAYDVEIIDGQPSRTVEEGTQVALSSGPKYPKEDYRFDGWKDASGNTYKPGQTITAAADLALTPIWVFEPSVYFDGNGYTGNMPASVKFQNQQAAIPSQQLSWNGYEFLGWSTDRDSRAAAFKPGSIINSEGKSLTLYAVWKAIEYQYTFRYVYGKPSMTKVQPFSAKDIAKEKATFEITLYGSFDGVHVGWRDVDSKKEYSLMDVFDELKNRTFEPIIIDKSDASMEKWTVKKY